MKIFLSSVDFLLPRLYSTMSNNAPLASIDFEVFGKVQGVFFRKHTQKKATAIGVRGWCMNTAQGTVVGQLQGPRAAVDEMKCWLEKEGSPKSIVEKALFKKEMPISECLYKRFDIRR